MANQIVRLAPGSFLAPGIEIRYKGESLLAVSGEQPYVADQPFNIFWTPSPAVEQTDGELAALRTENEFLKKRLGDAL